MGHVEALQLLLEAGADAEAQDRNKLTPLHCAVENGQPKSMQLLLEAGPDKEAQNRQGYTSLHAVSLQWGRGSDAVIAGSWSRQR